MKALILIGGFLLFGTSCYYDNMSSQRQFPVSKQQQDGSCKMTVTTGCFEGQIAVSPNVRVMDQNFFDANDLEQRFHELFEVSDEQSGKVLDFSEYEVRLQTSLDNDNFSKDFEVYFKGEYTRRGKVRSKGTFSLNKLIPGDYEVRVQKPINFTIVKPAFIAEDGEEQPEEILQTVCATLYQELTLEVLAGQRARPVFDEFQVMTRDLDCGSAKKTNSIAVRL